MVNHIAIEGLDGVGKTTIARALSERLDLPFVEKPWSLYTDEAGELTNYLRLTRQVNANESPFLKMCFYSLGTMLARQQYPDGLITDRFLISAMVHNPNEWQEEWFQLYATQVSEPRLTVILYANAQVRYERMTGRDATDPDIERVGDTEKQYETIRQWVERYEMRHLWIDTSERTVEEIVEQVIQAFNHET